MAVEDELKSGGKYIFNLPKSGARLLHIAFGSRSYTDIERRYQLFVGEADCGHWTIAHNRTFIWGTCFYWIYDYIDMKEIVD